MLNPATSASAGTDGSRVYSHNDPNSAYPSNAFLLRLLPFLRRIG